MTYKYRIDKTFSIKGKSVIIFTKRVLSQKTNGIICITICKTNVYFLFACPITHNRYDSAEGSIRLK